MPEPLESTPRGSPLLNVMLLGPGEESRLAKTLSDVFDDEILEERLGEFLSDPRHHLAIAQDEETVVGFASAVHYVHPDKGAELWINEVGVSEDFRQRGLGKALVRRLLEKGRELGCEEAWVLTDRVDQAATALYRSLGGVEPEAETVMFSFRLGADEPHEPEKGAL